MKKTHCSRELAVTATWLAVGLFAWRIALAVHRGVFLPLMPLALDIVAAWFPSPGMIGFCDAVLSHGANFIFAFLTALGLGMLSNPSATRVACFVLGADAVPIYYHLLQMAGYWQHHAGAPGIAVFMMTGGLAALLAGVPLFTLAGVFIGGRIRSGKKIAASEPT